MNSSLTATPEWVPSAESAQSRSPRQETRTEGVENRQAEVGNFPPGVQIIDEQSRIPQEPWSSCSRASATAIRYGAWHGRAIQLVCCWIPCYITERVFRIRNAKVVQVIRITSCNLAACSMLRPLARTHLNWYTACLIPGPAERVVLLQTPSERTPAARPVRKARGLPETARPPKNG